jgi:FAD/FMN-containing dehydrogenase
MNIYYRSIRSRERDYLKTLDYIWRWDTDWFWCSQVIHAQNPVMRRLLGRRRLNSAFYKKLIDWEPGYQVRKAWRRVMNLRFENVIQDVDVPIERAPAFLDFFEREIGLSPVWICPFKAVNPERVYPLFPTKVDSLYVNFGFWDRKSTTAGLPEGHYNRLIEDKLIELGGIKSLYSDSFFYREEFHRMYSGETYERLKVKYDPSRKLPDLYEKCVLRN